MSQHKRRNWTGAEKLRIVLTCMQPGVEVSEVCRRERINPTMSYAWKKKLMGSAAQVFDEKPKKDAADRSAAGHDAKMAVDGDPATFWMPGQDAIQASLTIDLGRPTVFDRAMLREMIAEGQRVERFNLEAWDGRAWKQFAAATTIGYKRLLRFPAVTASKVRLNILDARDCPMIREFGLFKASELERKAAPQG